MREDDLPGRVGELLRYGTVETVDLAAGRVTVRLGEIVTHPIRWMTGGAGDTRVWSRPVVGEQVMLLAPDGDLLGAIAIRGVTSIAHPHVGDEQREVVEFKDGTRVSHDPAAKAFRIEVAAGGTATVVAQTITLDGDVHVTGDVTVDGDVTAAGVSLRHHVHTGVTAGSSTSGEPQA